ncbi:MFS family permease [Chitinophaga terrae (ex Kim and Jung 2007)]|uniref:MFS transporter n=1 Tax=Chitinophaga terrae (ex Kim and Jung 2007) TaxID=408074 RepID=UPI0027837806|nr:MFS transporter [Chitinophaga terrae (ex Kim and Jung 2007)]MDQ0109187.1 MFS family permease [Chitinophaga terrae (ex Kim and Jung 2007)]
MQAHKIPIFKPWVNKWMARSVIFAILMTCLFSFAFYSSPVAAMGYYGIQPTDVQYAMIVLYGSTVAFLALDSRIVKYFAPRKYLVIALAINAVSSVTCFHSKDWTLFVVCQFVQGITCALMSGIVLQLTFPRLQSTRARVIAYSLLYGSIQISTPFYSIYSSVVLHFYDFNWLFYGLNIMVIILAFIVLLTMNGTARFTKKIPLYQVDWIGYLFYISFILTLGYILIYGRQLGWFDSPVIILLCLGNLALLLLFVTRETKMKRPLINLQIFKVKNFVTGLLLLFTFYIFKGSTGLAYGYLEIILGTDPLSTVPIWTAVIAGTVLSMFITSRFVLMGFNLARIIIVGFGFMAVYYAYMILFVSIQGETIDFILPMFIYGVATGVLFVPIVSFTASAAPPNIALNASFVGIFARFTGFTASLALSNELQLFTKSAAREKVRETLTEANPQLPVTMLDIQNQYMNAGSDIYTAKGVAGGYFNQLVGRQILARATRDYYDWMLVGVVGVILVLLLLPQIQNVVLRLRKGNIPY